MSRASDDLVWPAARQVVDRYAIDRPVPKTPAVRSTYTSRVRAGEAVGRRGCTTGQIRALASAEYRRLAAGEAGDKARQWEQRLRMHRDSTGMDAPITSSLRGAMGPPARRSAQSSASAPTQPQHMRPQSYEMRVGATIDGLTDEELDGAPPWPSAAIGAGGWEATELADTADGPPVPAPPAAIAFAWQHPTKLLQDIGNGKAAWGAKKQACLEAYLREVATPTPTPPAETPPPADADAASPAAAAAAAPRSPRHARPASAPAKPSMRAERAERVYRAAPSMSRPGSGGGANRSRPPWQPPSPPQQHVERTTGPQPQDEVNVLRRRAPPPLPSRPATAPPRRPRQQQPPSRPSSANASANPGWVDRLSGGNATAHDRRRRLAARVLA